jgi:hypothetical protein
VSVFEMSRYAQNIYEDEQQTFNIAKSTVEPKITS